MKFLRFAAICSSVLLVAGIVVAQGMSQSLKYRERGMSGEILNSDARLETEENRGHIGGAEKD